MPFKSAAQERFMFAKHPEIAQKWKAEHPQNASNMLKGTSPNGNQRLGMPKLPKLQKFSGWSK